MRETYLVARNEFEEAWLDGVVEPLFRATTEIVELDEVTIENLRANFWPVHLALCEQHGVETTSAIFERMEAVAEGERAAKQEHFEKEILPKAKRTAFWRGFLGLSIEHQESTSGNS